MKILVTGATGKFGPVLVKRLCEEKHDLRVLVHSTPYPDNTVEAVPGDITSVEDLKAACANVDCVCHLATVKGQTGRFLTVNVGGLHNLLERVRVMDPPPRVLLLSGDNVAGIYEHEHASPLDETSPYLFVDQEYGLSKIMEEVVAGQYAKKYGIPITVLRASWIMEGCRATQLCDPKLGGWEKYLPADLKVKLAGNEKFYVVPHDKYGRALRRHVVDPRDLAQAFVWALSNTDIDGGIFHIAGPMPFDYQVLADHLARIDYAPQFPIAVPDAFSFEISTAKARRAGFAAQYSIYDTVDWAFGADAGRCSGRGCNLSATR